MNRSDEATLAQQARAHALLRARSRPRYDDGPLAEAEYLADGVVARHADDEIGRVQVAQRITDRSADLHAKVPRSSSEHFALFLRHERTGHHDGRGSFMPVDERQCFQIGVHQAKRVRTATRHHDDDGLVAELELVSNLLGILDGVHVADVSAVVHVAGQRAVDLIHRRRGEHVLRPIES